MAQCNTEGVVPGGLRTIYPHEMWVSLCEGEFKELAIDVEDPSISVWTYQHGKWYHIVIPIIAILEFYDASSDLFLNCRDETVSGILPHAVAAPKVRFANRKTKIAYIRRIFRSIDRYGYNADTVLEIGFRVDMPDAYWPGDIKKLWGAQGRFFLSKELLSKKNLLNLRVQQECISFTQKVDGVYRRLRIPFDCMTYFLDHSARYRLILEDMELAPDQINQKEDTVIAESLNNKAKLYDKQGRYEKAVSLYQRSLSIREKVLGPEHLSVAENLNNLANLYDAQSLYAEAEPLLKRSLAILEKALGPDGAPFCGREPQQPG